MFLSGAMKRSTCAANHCAIEMVGWRVEPVGIAVFAHHRQVVHRAPRLVHGGLQDGGERPGPGDLLHRGEAVAWRHLRDGAPVGHRGDAADLGDDRLDVEDALTGDAYTRPLGGVGLDGEASEGLVLHPPRRLALLAGIMRTRPGAPPDDRRIDRQHVEALAQKGARQAGRQKSHRRRPIIVRSSVAWRRR